MNDIISLPPLEHIRSFVVFAESPNITTAAEDLKISQPLLTKHLHEIEVFLGLKLFEFSGRKKVLTMIGKEVHQSLKKQLTDLSVCLRHSSLLRDKSLPLRIGGRRELIERFVSCLRYDGSLSFHFLSSEQVQQKLRDKVIDIGVSHNEINSDQLVQKKLMSDEFVLCWNVGMKLDKDIEFQDAIDILKRYRRYKYAEEFPLNDVLQVTWVSDWRIIAEAISNEKAWGIIPIGYCLRENLRFKSLPANLHKKSNFYLYYQREFSRTDWFLSLIRQMLDSEIRFK